MTPRYDADLDRFIQQRRRTLRRRRVALVVFIAALLMSTVGALAYFAGSGAGQNANGAVGSLGAPGQPSTSVVGTAVHLSWTAAQLSNGSSTGVTYHVERRLDPGSTWTDVCGSSAASPISATSCADTPGVSTFVYRVTAEFNSWTKAGLESDPVTAEIVATKLVFTSSPFTTTAGVTSGTITVERQDASGNPGTAGTATISLSSTSGVGLFRNTANTATITSVSISAGNSDASFKYTDTLAGSPQLTVSDTPDSLTAASQTETISPASATSLSVAGYPSPTVAGATHSFTVTAKDPFGNTDTNYAGTVHVTSSDGQAALPADSTLTSGTKSFSATLKSAGAQSITGTDTGTSSITGSQTGITVNPASASTFTVSGFPSPRTAGVAGAFSVVAVSL